MSQQHPEPKAAPSSDLNARQEALLWAVADVGFFVLLVLISAAFRPDHSSFPGPGWLTAPVIGWVVGNLIAVAIRPRNLTVPSYVVVAVGLVVVAVCSVIFRGDSVEWGRAVAALVIGLGCGALFLRAWAAHQAGRHAG